MIDNDVTKGQNLITFLGKPYKSLIPPNHIETVTVKLSTGNFDIWNYPMYFYFCNSNKDDLLV
jgi:hypothetical protein